MLIGIDVGNTTITVGVFADGANIFLLHSWRLTTLHHDCGRMAAPVLARLGHVGISARSLQAAIVSSVVPVLEKNHPRDARAHSGDPQSVL